jgi:hypothetical protein
VFVALVIKQAKRTRCIILSSVASPSLQNLFTLSQNGKVIKRKMRTLIFIQVLSETFLILRPLQRDVITTVETPSWKEPIFLVTF